MTAAVDRFERRLVQEAAGLRQDIAGVRTEIANVEGRLRVELAKEMGLARQDLSKEIGLVRQDVSKEIGLVRQDISNNRVELLRWAFAFWAGQFFAVAGLVGAVLAVVLKTRA